MDDDIVAACLMTQGWRGQEKVNKHGHHLADDHQPHYFRAGDLRRLSRRLDVTPALHTPLMAVTNAISAIIIVGAMFAAALTETTLGKTMGVLAVALAAVNVFGGFLVTRRMLEMFKKKACSAGAAK
jgi:H+-translocating NAD(P) transhydrogenase subunit alpha